jgi:SAM-dependent methyltransferase
MNHYSGVLKIVRFNWPWYATGLLVTLTAVLCVLFGVLRGFWGSLFVAAAIVANFWLLVSLAVSHYIYDRSDISRGAWLDGLDSIGLGQVAIFHAGHDEASHTVARCLPSLKFEVFDFYSANRNGTASLKRARALNVRHDVPINLNKFPFRSGALDLALVVFAAHEIRQPEERAAFFRELGRVLAPTGRVVVVEHLRDAWNFFAYGLGAFHFLSRRTWHESFANGNLTLLHERALTPFVRRFELRNNS